MSDTDLAIAAIIPLYKGAAYIAQALDSVLAQDRPPDEIVVVDDGSPDDGAGAAVVQRVRDTDPRPLARQIRLLRKENGGQSSARNYGVAHTTSPLIALLDQDDRWYPNHLSELVRPFMRAATTHPPLAWVYSNLDEVDDLGQMVCHRFLSSLPGVQHPKTDIFGCLRTDMFVLPSASLILRSAFDAVNGFDERLIGYEDDDLFLRLFRAGYTNIYINRPLSQWRIYPQSTSYSPRMARSRMIYARKLFEEYGDDHGRSRFYRRDLLVPRFYQPALRAYRAALLAGDLAEIARAWEDVNMIAQYIPGRRGRMVRMTLATVRSPQRALRLFRMRNLARPVMVRAFG